MRVNLSSSCFGVCTTSVLLSLASCGSAVTARDVQNASAAVGVDPDDSPAQAPRPPWPAHLDLGDPNLELYIPHVEQRTSADTIRARVPIRVERANGTKHVGFVWMDAHVLPSPDGREVTLSQVRFVRAELPFENAEEGGLVALLNQHHALERKMLSVRQIDADIDGDRRHMKNDGSPVFNEPPQIIFAREPTILVLIDGAPVVRRDHGIRRVINSRALIVQGDGGRLWIYAAGRWFSRPGGTTGDEGDYVEADPMAIPEEVEPARIRLGTSSQVDLYDGASEKIRAGAHLLVTTKPTELIEIRGAPVYASIPSTTLSYVQNTDADVFRDASGATPTCFVLVAGRWFRSSALTNGSEPAAWTFVPATELPKAFGEIPHDHPKAHVLASIPGTPEAEESLIAAQIATMMTVDRSRTHLAVAFDGPPSFESIAGATGDVRSAVNTATPVIESNGAFFALDDGVWFTATSAEGPWQVATSVPDAVYTIPTSSPLHYVTYARIYDVTPDWVFIDYTPGYYGAVTTGGAVVWGTGVRYRPWIGRVWYGRPITWGFGAHFGFYGDVGFAFGGAVWGHPWWGPSRWAWHASRGWGPDRRMMRTSGEWNRNAPFEEDHRLYGEYRALEEQRRSAEEHAGRGREERVGGENVREAHVREPLEGSNAAREARTPEFHDTAPRFHGWSGGGVRGRR